MPDITVVQIGLLTLAAVVGIIAGWVMRGNRCAQEKLAVNAGWQEQLEAQRSEHDRLLGQNKNLMEQVSQYQASQKDATNRAKELSSSLKEAFGKRAELQHEIKDVRNTLQAAVGERYKLQVKLKSRGPGAAPRRRIPSDDGAGGERARPSVGRGRGVTDGDDRLPIAQAVHCGHAVLGAELEIAPDAVRFADDSLRGP